MKLSRPALTVMGAFIAMAILPSFAQAEIYKWVDENGRTHYSERKEDAGRARPEEVKIQQKNPSGQSADSSAWQEKELQFRQRWANKQNSEPQRQANSQPPSLSGGRSGNTDESKCNLARDVLNGAVGHRNGAPIDKNDRDIAEGDVKRFCH